MVHLINFTTKHASNIPRKIKSSAREFLHQILYLTDSLLKVSYNHVLRLLFWRWTFRWFTLRGLSQLFKESRRATTKFKNKQTAHWYRQNFVFQILSFPKHECPARAKKPWDTAITFSCHSLWSLTQLCWRSTIILTTKSRWWWHFLSLSFHLSRTFLTCPTIILARTFFRYFQTVFVEFYILGR